MESSFLALHACVLLAALLQAATGIGFGVIAGPIVLLVLNDGSAVQMTILLSLLVSVLFVPSLYRKVDKKLLKRLLVGTFLGLPLGVYGFLQVSVDVLKLVAAIAVLVMAALVTGRLGSGTGANGRISHRWRDVGVGVVSGAMSVSLAMPGPVAAAHMAVLNHTKEVIRATALVLFAFSYSAAIAFQALVVGVSRDTLSHTALLVPATLAGVYLGHKAVGHIQERTFRNIIAAVLVASAAGLLLTLIGGVLDHG